MDWRRPISRLLNTVCDESARPIILMTYLMELSISLSLRERASSFANSVFTMPVELRSFGCFTIVERLLVLLF